MMHRFSATTESLLLFSRQVVRNQLLQQRYNFSTTFSSPDRTARSAFKSPFTTLSTHESSRFSSRLSGSRQRRQFSKSKQLGTAQASQRPAPPDNSLSGRLRKLSREYGWSALGVYLLLSALDFPFCFLAVRWLGTDRIGRWEHAVLEFVKKAIPFQWPERWGGSSRLTKDKNESDDEKKTGMGYDHGVKQAQEKNSSESATLWTQLALAYAIHKSFIFLRVPLTAAATPKVVKTLRSWGWNIGKRPSKGEKIIPVTVKDISKKA